MGKTNYTGLLGQIRKAQQEVKNLTGLQKLPQTAANTPQSPLTHTLGSQPLYYSTGAQIGTVGGIPTNGTIAVSGPAGIIGQQGAVWTVSNQNYTDLPKEHTDQGVCQNSYDQGYADGVRAAKAKKKGRK